MYHFTDITNYLIGYRVNSKITLIYLRIFDKLKNLIYVPDQQLAELNSILKKSELLPKWS